MIGWLITAGIIGAAIGSRNSTQYTSTTQVTYIYQPKRDYGNSIPISHRTCKYCHYHHTSVYVIEGTSRFVSLKFRCNHCGHVWVKNYNL